MELKTIINPFSVQYYGIKNNQLKFLNSFSVYQEILRIKNNQLKYLNSFSVYQVILRIKKKNQLKFINPSSIYYGTEINV